MVVLLWMVHFTVLMAVLDYLRTRYRYPGFHTNYELVNFRIIMTTLVMVDQAFGLILVVTGML